MTLILQITNVDRLENGIATRLVLDRHGAVIGRSPTADWSLPDPQHFISSTHCEIDYRDGAYSLIDTSTNGTFLNGAQTRMAGRHAIAEGDEIVIGHYRICARLEGDAAASAAATPGTSPSWNGWCPQPAAGGVDAASWDRPAAQPAISGRGPLSQNWAAPSVERPAPPGSAWAAPAAPASPASAWSSPVAGVPVAPSASDVWGRLTASNVVDWARGGFGDSQQSPAGQFGLPTDPAASRPDPLGYGAPAVQPPAGPPDPAAWATPAAGPVADAWAPASPQVQPVPWGPNVAARPFAGPASPVPPPAPSPSPPAGAELAAFLAGVGLQATDLKTSPAQAMNMAGSVMRRVLAGLVVMLEARARAKSQLGAPGTSLEFDGNNPLKFARAPEKAVAQLLNPPERGFMSADRAIEDAFRDLQAHQMATLAAMQGALAATLARFSPAAIRGRADNRGLLAKILPGAREAALWQIYEREFEGVARGSDEAFMDVFAKEFRLAYERVSADMKRKV